MVEKLAKIASMLWVSTETISKMTDEASIKSSNTTPDATVTKVEIKTEEFDISKLSDEEINKMSEQEAKDTIKKVRDMESEEDAPVVEKKGIVARINKMPDMNSYLKKSM